MMFFIVLLVLLFCFSFILLFGAPYVPTMKAQQTQALKLLDLKPGQTLLELGSGDGRFLVAAAKQGIKVAGYELNPIMFLVSLFITFKYRRLVKVHLGSFWRADLAKTDGIYVFLLPKFMAKLNKKIIQSKCKNVKVVSYAAAIPGRKAVKTQGPMYLYRY